MIFANRFFCLKEVVGTYSVSLPIASCVEQPKNATLIATYQLPDHEITIQLNLTGMSRF
jgi:hypothetical protein